MLIFNIKERFIFLIKNTFMKFIQFCCLLRTLVGIVAGQNDPIYVK
jgi:hypothetical protein